MKRSLTAIAKRRETIIEALRECPATLRLQGDLLGTNGTSQISLNSGMNLVGVPVTNRNVKRVSDLLALERIAGNPTAIVV